MEIDSIITPRQRRLVGYGLASAGILVVGLLIAITVALAIWVLRRIDDAVAPLVIGLFLSLSLRPVFDRVRRLCLRVGMKSVKWINALAVLVFMLPLVVVLSLLSWWLVHSGINQISSFCAGFPVLWNRLLENFPKLSAALGSLGVSREAFLKDQLPQFIVAHIGQLASVKNLVSTWLFAVFFAVCFLVRPLKSRDVVDEIRTLPLLSKSNWDFLGRQLCDFERIMSVYLPKQIGINLLEGVIGSIGLWLLDIPYGGILGFLMGFLNIIPVYGTVAMLPVVLLVAMFGEGGSWTMFWLSFGVWGVVELADLILPNKIHGDELNLSPGVIVFSFLFWSALISPIWGMILAIPLSAFAISFWNSIKALVSRKNQIEEEKDKHHG